jgi:hypothetical protein
MLGEMMACRVDIKQLPMQNFFLLFQAADCSTGASILAMSIHSQLAATLACDANVHRGLSPRIIGVRMIGTALEGPLGR